MTGALAWNWSLLSVLGSRHSCSSDLEGSVPFVMRLFDCSCVVKYVAECYSEDGPGILEASELTFDFYIAFILRSAFCLIFPVSSFVEYFCFPGATDSNFRDNPEAANCSNNLQGSSALSVSSSTRNSTLASCLCSCFQFRLTLW